MDDALPSLADLDAFVDTFAQTGWASSDIFFPVDTVKELALEAEAGFSSGEFHRARVGRGDERSLRSEIRQDRVCWLEPNALSSSQQVYWSRIDALRLALNRSLFLGLFDYEAHFAVFPPGAFYKKHLDQFQGVGVRTVSCILYLSTHWSPNDGGALRLFFDAGHEDILPISGRFVCFLSGEFYHEVLPANRERMSLTGWLRKRTELPIPIV